MAKKSFFERLGLVENTNSVDSALAEFDASEYSLTDNETEMEQVVPTFDLGGEDFLTVEEVYGKSSLGDLSKSIFKVDEFSKVLPNSLPTEARRQSVIGILAASNLNVESLITDANERIQALQSVKLTTTENTTNIIVANEKRIAELLREVDDLKQQNNDRQAAQEKQDEILDTEVKHIEEITKFISPETK